MFIVVIYVNIFFFRFKIYLWTVRRWSGYFYSFNYKCQTTYDRREY